ncbi:non-ribosomal peptide synthetase [Amycolatopsis sp. CA-230715]|uniref:non-ribosomal peptide synthetase n=1 Tax=Amycolatopsis sp. CA-230715 TaxID=2745196 RepID=UPI001C343064|nr:non-ribosomal peptide synthetase [Amycolatopsis sp. CA-230715]QWF84793.1 D-alanine--poly(phosphoribitol) ligase subunit 1 [Amycolatopsis sp. CA-230715]
MASSGEGDGILHFERMRADVAAGLDLLPAQVGADDDLLRLGLDSLGLMRLATRWRHAGARITFAELIESRTLAEWWDLVSARMGEADAAPLLEVDPAAPFALAELQHAYWIGRDAGQPLGGVGAHFYNEFDGTGVDPDRLGTALAALVRRHPMLRAVFLDDGTQRIAEHQPETRITVHDLRALSAHRAEERLAELREEISHRKLAVERGEVFDVRLSLLPQGATRMHVSIEMLAADAHSFRNLLSDLAALYADPGAPLPPIRLSYQQYLLAAARTREPERDRDREYWRARLDELPGPPELPLAVAPERVHGHRVRRWQHRLSAAADAALREQARRHGLTVSVVLLTAFAEILAAWSASPRFLLNLPLYDRRPVHEDVPMLVGDFTGLLVLAADMAPGDGFAAAATRLQERMRADAAHAAYSGLDVLRDLAARRGAAGAPVVFTSALSLGELFDERVRARFGEPGWTMSQTPQVWLDFQVTEREGGIFLNWDVVAELFPPGMVDAMFAAYLRLLAWATGPSADWSAAPPEPLGPSARQVRTKANEVAMPVRDRGLHDDVLAWAERDPGRTALLCGDVETTYGELARASADLAGRLAARGVGRGAVVAISLPKGAEQIVAVLAILRTGAAYVPVGVGQPAMRRDRILRAAGARFVVGTHPADDLPPGIETVPVDGEPAVRWESEVAACDEDVAYLLFTSGSTGEPKGVVVSHAAAVNTVDAIVARFGIGPGDRALALSALDFDLSVFDVFGLLGAGGSLVVPREDELRDAHRFVGLVRAHRVTVWQTVPALLDMLLLAADGARLDSLRLALLGGDWVPVDIGARLHAVAPGAVAVALGGTTETAIHSTVQVVPPDPPDWTSVPYGRPLPNQLLRVADHRWRDRPDWVPGELWIGGGSVADGYHGDPDRTARQFVHRAGKRWYRTGDLARYRPDGTVEFLGRADHQVKIGGHRIELGEVEAAFEAVPEVARAVVVVTGARALAAAVLPVTGAEPEPDGLRALAAERVPAYMVPSFVDVLDEFPLSTNGKVDRAALAALLAGHRGAETDEPPLGPVETAVAEAWTAVLDVPEVGRGTSFFALGGDSLLATKVVNALRAAGYPGADLRRLFARPRLSDFAADLERGDAVVPEARLVPAPEHRHEPFQPTDVQRAYWVGRKDDFALGGVGSHWYWEFDGEDVDLARLEDAVNRLVARHDMLRCVFDDLDGSQRVLPSVPRFTIETTGSTEADLSALREDLSTRVPDPASWPLLHIRAVRYGTCTRLGFSFDYIVLDALSIIRFLHELATLYRDPGTEFAPLTATFRDYLATERDPAIVARAKDYWLSRLDTLPPAPPLPLVADPARITAPRFVRREGTLAPEEWQAIVARARRHDLTPSAVLGAAYAEVLATWSGAAELTLNLTLFNRRDVHADIQRVLGDFTSLLLVEHRAGPGDGWLDVARRFQENLWDGMANDAVSALWVLRELAARTGTPSVTMPVVFTSALGMPTDLVEMSFPFGELCWGLSQTPQVWLDNQVMERGGGLAYNWDSVDELFPPGVLDDMFAAYRALLGWLATADWTGPPPDLVPAAQRAVRARVNDTAGHRPKGLLHTDFFANAAESPDAIALIDDGVEVSYGELSERALRIAAELTARGVRTGDMVVVSLPRGADQVAAVFGVLAAGAAYVPIGVDQPAQRRSRIVARAGARFAVADFDGPFAEEAGVRIVPPDPATAPADGPVAVDPGTPAYVIFTSGSTGQPKGVEVTHAAALNTVDDIGTRFAVTAADRVLALSALDFDLSVYDLFGLLGAGGAAVLVAEEDRREARVWLRLVAEYSVTVWNTVPALLDMALIAADGGDSLAGLRLALVSGDWVGLDLPGRFALASPRGRLVALGGATEAAIWSNAFDLGGWTGVPESWASIPYGFPLRNQYYRVVDHRGRDCPDLVPGELWIGGAGVATGYRGDPELTAERFVLDGNARWYRTGDRGRYWPDGTLEFLGRADSQVKIRGHRIELGEIEAAARAHPGIASAVALVTGTGTARALALVVVPETELDEVGLKASLRGSLPAYMVPDRLLTLDELPRSPNGKLDRAVLLSRLDGEPERHSPPETPAEQVLARLWGELLDTTGIGRDQSFFALGGDSLLATRLTEQLRVRHGAEVSLREVFAAPTVAELAVLCAAKAASFDEDFEEGVL